MKFRFSLMMYHDKKTNKTKQNKTQKTKQKQKQNKQNNAEENETKTKALMFVNRKKKIRRISISFCR